MGYIYNVNGVICCIGYCLLAGSNILLLLLTYLLLIDILLLGIKSLYNYAAYLFDILTKIVYNKIGRELWFSAYRYNN